MRPQRHLCDGKFLAPSIGRRNFGGRIKTISRESFQRQNVAEFRKLESSLATSGIRLTWKRRGSLPRSGAIVCLYVQTEDLDEIVRQGNPDAMLIAARNASKFKWVWDTLTPQFPSINENPHEEIVVSIESHGTAVLPDEVDLTLHIMAQRSRGYGGSYPRWIKSISSGN